MEFFMRRGCLVVEEHENKKVMSKNGERKNDKLERPPYDDCCPICFGDFTLPCRTSCGHWFCAGCILEVWHYRAAPQRCKCPICCCLIKNLVPEASLQAQKEEEVVGVLRSVQEYNHLYAGGFHGLLMKVRASPLLTRSIFQNLIDPGRLKQNYYIMRFFALLLASLYHIYECDFIPAGIFHFHPHTLD
ncbi:hypothetical protein Leryth_011878 [Lithospermum erythrorhizon]|nr:hypothetical protein Leryth_011878 [Lithospermum erythrorhizon]